MYVHMKGKDVHGERRSSVTKTLTDAALCLGSFAHCHCHHTFAKLKHNSDSFNFSVSLKHFNFQNGKSFVR